MKHPFVQYVSLPEWYRHKKDARRQRTLVGFALELTARCNNNCRHCYINLPARDRQAKQKELSFKQIKHIVDQAVDLGALWCLITGGEPLLREDFCDIYTYLKKKGLLVSVFTNAVLINDSHIQLFKKYPPRDVEVTVYGVTEETYERVTRAKGSFKGFMWGLDMLLKNNIKVRLKAMALRSNVKELPEIAAFCRQRTKDYYRFDPFLHLRFDADAQRNEEIKAERLSAAEIVALEKTDPERFDTLQKDCDKLVNHDMTQSTCNHLFPCGTGISSFTVGYDGLFRLCSSLCHPDCVYDLTKGSLAEAWQTLVPRVHNMRSSRDEFLKRCCTCELFNLCLWCPAHAYLESGELDKPIEYFCELAHERAEALLPEASSGRNPKRIVR